MSPPRSDVSRRRRLRRIPPVNAVHVAHNAAASRRYRTAMLFARHSVTSVRPPFCSSACNAAAAHVVRFRRQYKRGQPYRHRTRRRQVAVTRVQVLQAGSVVWGV